MSALLDELDKQAEKEGTGGGIVGQFKFEAGYKLYIAGLGNRESFFPYLPGNQASQDAALAKAKETAAKYDGGKNPQTCAQLVIYKNSVKGRTVTWKDDRFFSYPIWTDGYKKGLKPKLAELRMDHFGDYWGKIGFIPDPGGRKKKDQEGNETVELIAIPVALFANEQEAIKAVAAEAKANGGAPASIPDGYTADTWGRQKEDIAKLRLNYIKGGAGGDEATEKVAKDYGASVEQVAALLGLTVDEAHSVPF